MARPADPNAKSALIAAARREFLRQGLGRARIEDVTAACGLSKGAFYLHFKSKEALFGELVEQVRAGLDEVLRRREAEQQAWMQAHAPLRPRDLRPGSPLVAQMKEWEQRHDRAVLELMWEWRDVVIVLLRGAQGTEFADVMWRLVDREGERVAATVEQMKAVGLTRPDLPGEVVAAMVMGTWLLVVRRMVELEQKPDLDYWVRSVSALIAEGSAPRPDQPVTAPRGTKRAQKTAGPRAQARKVERNRSIG